MTLASSGTMSIGGTTSTRSINLELGRSGTATSNLGETDLRTLAGVSSGAISISNFYNKSNSLDSQTITVGQGSGNRFGFSNFSSVGWTGGSITDGTCNFKSGTSYKAIYHSDNTNRAYLFINGNQTNAGFSTMTVSSITGSDPTVTYTRTDAIFNVGSTSTYWTWRNQVAEPFGSTTGTLKLVTFN